MGVSGYSDNLKQMGYNLNKGDIVGAGASYLNSVGDLFGGNWDVGGSKKKAKREKRKQAQYREDLKTRDSILKNLDSKENTIDRETASELKALLQQNYGSRESARSYVGKASSLLKEAQEGVLDKYKGRLQADALHDLLVDMPGAKQTRIDGFAQASMQMLGRR